MSPSLSRSLLWGLLVSQAAAFPQYMDSVRADLLEKRENPPHLPKNNHESNTGVIKSKTFNAQDQYVDVTPGSANEWVAPGEGDLRGPCPGLNAAANHGFLPHNGITTITQTITGLEAAYNIGADLAGALAVIAVALDGDYLSETWSIGGPYTSSVPGLLANPGGISYSHNKYEGDSSVARYDAYLNHGDAYSLSVQHFDALYFLDTSYTLATTRKHAAQSRKYGIANNPYLFYAPFSGLVSTAAHEFVINLMSNHSEEVPSGYLDRSTLKQFFSITGPDNAHKWTPGYERIPLNWYRRPSSNQYNTVVNGADDGISLATYPILAQFGGNMGKTNSFVGVNPEDLTEGAYNSKTLLQGNNLGCFMFQASQAALPDQLEGLVKDIQPVLDLVAKYLGPVYTNLGCPPIGKFNFGLFNDFPGYHYNPKASNPGEGGSTQ